MKIKILETIKVGHNFVKFAIDADYESFNDILLKRKLSYKDQIIPWESSEDSIDGKIIITLKDIKPRILPLKKGLIFHNNKGKSYDDRKEFEHLLSVKDEEMDKYELELEEWDEKRKIAEETNAKFDLEKPIKPKNSEEIKLKVYDGDIFLKGTVNRVDIERIAIRDSMKMSKKIEKQDSNEEYDDYEQQENHEQQVNHKNQENQIKHKKSKEDSRKKHHKESKSIRSVWD